VWADTPIGPGATGTGGTGPNAADSSVRHREGGEAAPKRRDGMPTDEADSKVRANARAGAAVTDRDGSASHSGTGASSGAGASGGGSQVQKERRADED
jgi:hypothetical protein